MLKKISLLIFSILICQLAGVIGSFFTSPAIQGWYTNLTKPVFSPPNWLFGPAWIMLYILMGIALYLIWQKIPRNLQAKPAVILFFIHLFFNTIWSIVFFGWHQIFLGLINIIIIWVFIILLMQKFWSIDKRASYLLIPYLIWVSFAMILNLSLWVLN